EIGEALDQTFVRELVDQLLAQAVDVHRVAVSVPADPLLELIGAAARGIRAVVVHLFGRALDPGPAARALGWEPKPRLVPFASVDLDADDLGDDLAGLLDHDGVADADVLALELVGVVQAGAPHGRAGQQDRLELGHGRQLAGLADLHRDPGQPRHGLLSLVLERDRPAPALPPRPEPLPLVP